MTVWTPGMARDPSIVAAINRIGRRRHVGRRLRRAALKTGAVETRFENLPGGDADSVNWRQERASIYGGDMSVRRSVNRFFNEAQALDRGQSAGRLAADVQRPRADLRGRYSQEKVGQLLNVGVRGSAAGGTRARRAFSMTMGKPGSVSVSRETQFDSPAYHRAQALSFLASRLGGDSVLFRSGLLSRQAPDPADFMSSRLVSKLTPATMPTLTGRTIGGRGGVGGGAQPGGQVGHAVRAARKRLGISEVDGSNRGGKVDKWESKFGMVGQPWCGIFAGVVLRHAGVKGVSSRVASVAAIEADARSGRGPFEAWVSTRHARAGDLLVTSKGQHVAVIEKVDRNGTIHVIGGNQGDGRVSRGTYAPGQGYGVARVRYRRR